MSTRRPFNRGGVGNRGGGGGRGRGGLNGSGAGSPSTNNGFRGRGNFSAGSSQRGGRGFNGYNKAAADATPAFATQYTKGNNKRQAEDDDMDVDFDMDQDMDDYMDMLEDDTTAGESTGKRKYLKKRIEWSLYSKPETLAYIRA